MASHAKLLDLEDKVEAQFKNVFTEQSTSCCCGKMSLQKGTRVICMFVIFACVWNLMNTLGRIGAPCFHFWDHFSTMITVVLGVSLRLCAIPLCVICEKAVRTGQGADTSARNVFFFLLAASVVVVIDIGITFFEVHTVCNSDSMQSWHLCEAEWASSLCSKKQWAIDECALNATKEGTCCQRDANSKVCSRAPCDINDQFHDPANWPHGRCGGFLNEDGTCEMVSDVYDIGFNLVWGAMLVYWAYVINSYRKALDCTTDTVNSNNVNRDPGGGPAAARTEPGPAAGGLAGWRAGRARGWVTGSALRGCRLPGAMSIEVDNRSK
eukprot:SAG22_NODE_4308_length_1310_cov_1.261767_2_plen_324_part_00